MLRRMHHRNVVLLSLVSLAACGSDGSAQNPVDASAAAPDSAAIDASANDTGAPPADGAAADAGPIGGDRPVDVHVPKGYVPGTPTPLVIMLHGYTASGAIEESYLGITPLSDSMGFLYAHPDGLVDKTGNRYWNATDACCDFTPTNVDDSGYLSTLIVQISQHYSVDPKRVFFMGHSNGGFMSYRMACDHADQIAAIVSLAGAMPSDASLCKPSTQVSVLEIHGTADTVIGYTGGQNLGHAYPGAQTSVADWVTLDGCASSADTSSPNLDLDAVLPGNETTVSKWASGCKPGGHVELWTITGGSHIPTLSSSFTKDFIDFLFAHPKP